MYKFFTIAVIAILLGISNVGAKTTTTKQVNISKQDVQRMINVIANIQHYYIEPVDTSKLFDYAINGMVTKLDPHSSYLDPESLKNLDIITSGKFDGIGITVSPVKDALKVITPIDDSPAKRAGLKAGDFIIRVNNTLIRDISITKAIAMMRGKKGASVTLYVIRHHKLLKFTMKRDTIKIPTIKENLLENHYGYLRIAIFHKPTKTAVANAIKQLQAKSKGQLQGLIIDLRNNPGGMLESSVATTNMFLDAKKLKKNKLIVYIKGRATKEEDFKATEGETLPNVPIVVLINSGSASAAEIMAGALQDHKRAIILGTRSFGKGSVQKVLMLDKDHALKLTVALYYTPAGKSIQAKGIQPDVVIPEIKIPKTEDTSAFDPLYEADLQNHLQNGDDTQPKQQKSEAKLMHTDFQLYEALNVLKGLSAVQTPRTK